MSVTHFLKIRNLKKGASIYKKRFASSNKNLQSKCTFRGLTLDLFNNAKIICICIFTHFFTLFVKTNIIKTSWYHIAINWCFLWISISLQKIGRQYHETVRGPLVLKMRKLFRIHFEHPSYVYILDVYQKDKNDE